MQHEIEDKQRRQRRHELLWSAVQNAVYQRNICLQTSEASRNLLDDPLVSDPFGAWDPEARASLENTERKALKEAEEYDAKIDEGYLMLNEFERANGLPLSFRMEGKV